MSSAIFRMSFAAIVLAAGSAPAQSVVEIPGTPQCSNCRITLAPLANLGGSSGSSMLEAESNLLKRDSRGRYFVYIGGPPYFWVFAPDGRFIARIGRRGSGPQEYNAITSIVVSPEDSIYVFDFGLQRVSVYAPDLAYRRSMNVKVPDAKGIFAGNQILLNGGIRATGRLGYPLHLMTRDGRIEKSFGAENPTTFRPDRAEIFEQRAFDVAADGTIWTGWIKQYVLQQWAQDGRMLRSLSRKADWFPAWWTFGAFGPDTPPQHHLRAMSVSGDTLWTMTVLPDPDWRSSVTPSGRSYRVVDPIKFQDTVIEAVDVKSNRLIVSTRIDQPLVGFVGRRAVYGPQTDRSGNPVAAVWQLSIQRAQR